MKYRLSATLIALSAACSYAPAHAATDITVSALTHCVDIAGSTVGGGKQTFLLAPGRYVASLVNNTMSCANGSLTGSCLIDTVVVRGWDGIFPPGTAEWGVSVKNPIVFDIPGSAAVSFAAFVIDAPCNDNTGQSTLRFQLAN